MHVAVIGAGIVGVSTAIWLQRAGHSVTLIDRKGPGEGASYGNAGVLAAASVVPVTVPGLLAKAPRMLLDPGQPLFLRWRHLPRLAPWLARYLRHCRPEEVRRIARALRPIIGEALADHQALAAGTAAARHIAPSDYLFLYESRAKFAADGFGWGLRRDLGYRWEELEGGELRNYDPVVAPAYGFAARLPEHGRIADPGAYVKALAAHAEGQGARLILAEAEDVVRRDGRVTGVRVGGETLACDAAVIAAGAWSGALARKLGLAIPLESERGYHVELWGANMMPRAPIMVVQRKIVITPMEGRLRLAGIVEFGGLEAPPNPAAFQLLLCSAKAAIPGLFWRETTEWLGHRPAPSDSIPVIGAVPGVAGAWLGFGHHHVGMTGGPKTGRLLAQMICGERPALDMAPYAPARRY